MHSLLQRILWLCCLWLVSTPLWADYQLNFQEPVTQIAQEVYDLHMIIFWICVVIAFIVFGVMFYSIFAHRKSKVDKAAQFHENTTVEIIWTVIPFVILISMAVPATKTLIAMDQTAHGDMTIKITASQFKWHYSYLDEEISFTSALTTPEAQIYEAEAKGENYLLEVDNPLVVPIDTRIRFLLTAADVIHAWWVPAISLKKDAVPGFINEMWTQIDKPGVYRGQCAELCGEKHGFMPIVLEAKPKEEYLAWLQQKQDEKAAELAALAAGKEWSLTELMERGEKVFQGNCAVCHQTSGEGMPPTFPALKGSILVMQAPAEEQVDLILNGRNVMPAFGATLSDLELAAVITYTKNAWGNNLGKTVQPSTVKDLR